MGSPGWPWGRKSLKPANRGTGSTVTLHNECQKRTRPRSGVCVRGGKVTRGDSGRAGLPGLRLRDR